MKLIARKKLNIKVDSKEEKTNTLPPDEYKVEFEPIRHLVKDFVGRGGESVKQYIELSVKRFNDDEGLPYVWVQMYQESLYYTGYLKGKCVYFPLSMIEEFISCVDILDNECIKRHLGV